MSRPQITYTYQQVLDRRGNVNPNSVRATQENGHVMFISAPIPGMGGIAMPSHEWMQYQAWLEAGNTPEPPPITPSGAPRVELPEPMDPAIKQYIDDQIDQLKGG